MPTKKPARLGRPPASSSAETRLRILDVARESFAELGYGVTTNKYLATKAGITTGALYHYFDSKVEIYKAVYEHVQDYVYSKFEEAVADTTTFVERFEAMLEAAHQLDNQDPSLARFLGAARIDIARHDDLRQAMTQWTNTTRPFFRAMVEVGVSTGEIAPEDRETVLAFMQIVTIGLSDGFSGRPNSHRRAVDSIRAVLEGRLLSGDVGASGRASAAPAAKAKPAASTKKPAARPARSR